MNLIHPIRSAYSGIFVTIALCAVAHAAKPLKVFILAGQSNMQGSAHLSTFAAMGEDSATAPLLAKVLDGNGKPLVCDNAWITYKTQRGGTDVTLQGKVEVGYGFDDERIGPEYGFGMTMDEAFDEPVLIIKTAWGGKSLAVDFRPPSAGPYLPSEQEKAEGRIPNEDEVGHYYREMMTFIRATLKDDNSIQRIVPTYSGEQGYELSGFVWFQGWNDMCNRHHISQYTDNMIHFIHDVRSELKSPKLPFVVGVLGVYGTDPDARRFDKGLPVSTFRKTQFAAVDQYDQKVEEALRGGVTAVDSGPFYDLELSDLYWKRRLVENWKQRMQKGEMTEDQFRQECAVYKFGDGQLSAKEQQTWDSGASNAEYHYLGSGRTFFLIGQAFANALLKTEHP